MSVCLLIQLFQTASKLFEMAVVVFVGSSNGRALLQLLLDVYCDHDYSHDFTAYFTQIVGNCSSLGESSFC